MLCAELSSRHPCDAGPWDLQGSSGGAPLRGLPLAGQAGRCTCPLMPGSAKRCTVGTSASSQKGTVFLLGRLFVGGGSRATLFEPPVGPRTGAHSCGDSIGAIPVRWACRCTQHTASGTGTFLANCLGCSRGSNSYWFASGPCSCRLVPRSLPGPRERPGEALGEGEHLCSFSLVRHQGHSGLVQNCVCPFPAPSTVSPSRGTFSVPSAHLHPRDSVSPFPPVEPTAREVFPPNRSFCC